MSDRIEIETDMLNSDKDSIADEIKEIKNELELLRDDTVGMNPLWEGPAAAAYQSRMAEDIENALQVCTELAEYVSCMEYASREYVSCEQSIESIVNRIRV